MGPLKRLWFRSDEVFAQENIMYINGDRNIYEKFHYQRRSVSHRYQSRRCPGKKIQQRGNFLQQKLSSAKRKHRKEEIYIKVTVPLTVPVGNLPEIVPIHQLRHIHPMVQNLFPNVKVSNFLLAGVLQYFVKHCKKLARSPKF